MGKCLRCSKQIVSENGICSACFKIFSEEEEERKQNREYHERRKKVLNKYRVRKNRALSADPEENGFASPLLMSEQEFTNDLEKEKRLELTKLKQRHVKTPDPDLDPNKTFEAYEKWLREHDGDHRLWANQHGYEPQSLKAEFVEFVGGKLIHAKVCEKCGCVNCKCPKLSNQQLNFTFEVK